MKPGKATRTVEIAAELCIAKNWNPTFWLSEFFNEIIEGNEAPPDWQKSITHMNNKSGLSKFVELSTYKHICYAFWQPEVSMRWVK